MSNNNNNNIKDVAKKEHKFWKKVGIAATVVAAIPMITLIIVKGCGDVEK